MTDHQRELWLADCARWEVKPWRYWVFTNPGILHPVVLPRGYELPGKFGSGRLTRRSDTVLWYGTPIPRPLFHPDQMNDGDHYWFVSVDSDDLVEDAYWSGDDDDKLRLYPGYLYVEESDAVAAAKVIKAYYSTKFSTALK